MKIEKICKHQAGRNFKCVEINKIIYLKLWLCLGQCIEINTSDDKVTTTANAHNFLLLLLQVFEKHSTARCVPFVAFYTSDSVNGFTKESNDFWSPEQLHLVLQWSGTVDFGRRAAAAAAAAARKSSRFSTGTGMVPFSNGLETLALAILSKYSGLQMALCGSLDISK